jgi:hypothetical protein
MLAGGAWPVFAGRMIKKYTRKATAVAAIARTMIHPTSFFSGSEDEEPVIGAGWNPGLIRFVRCERRRNWHVRHLTGTGERTTG